MVAVLERISEHGGRAGVARAASRRATAAAATRAGWSDVLRCAKGAKCAQVDQQHPARILHTGARIDEAPPHSILTRHCLQPRAENLRHLRGLTIDDSRLCPCKLLWTVWRGRLGGWTGSPRRAARQLLKPNFGISAVQTEGWCKRRVVVSVAQLELNPPGARVPRVLVLVLNRAMALQDCPPDKAQDTAQAQHRIQQFIEFHGWSIHADAASQPGASLRKP